MKKTRENRVREAEKVFCDSRSRRLENFQRWGEQVEWQVVRWFHNLLWVVFMVLSISNLINIT